MISSLTFIEDKELIFENKIMESYNCYRKEVSSLVWSTLTYNTGRDVRHKQEKT